MSTYQNNANQNTIEMIAAKKAATQQTTTAHTELLSVTALALGEKTHSDHHSNVEISTSGSSCQVSTYTIIE